MLLKIKNLPIHSNSLIYSKCLNQDLWDFGITWILWGDGWVWRECGQVNYYNG